MSEKNVSILIAGDLIPQDVDTGKEREDLQNTLRKNLSEADIRICHLGQMGKTLPDSMANSIIEMGFNTVAVANNHSSQNDYNEVLLRKHVLEDLGLHVAGVQLGTDGKPYALYVVNSVKVAVIDYSYASPAKATSAGKEILVNYFCFETLEEDLASIQSEITAARLDGADVVILYLHWPEHCENYSSVSEKYVAYCCAQMGADAVIGSHGRVLQEFETLHVSVQGQEKDVPVFYGLGNCCLEESYNDGTDAVVAKLSVRTEDERTIIEAGYIPLHVLLEQSDEQAVQRIDGILRDQIRPVPIETHFKEPLQLEVGQKKTLSVGELTAVASENAIVVSVLKNGEIVGNSAGYAAITAKDAAGTLHGIMVRVEGVCESGLPVLVNDNNPIYGEYRPYSLVGGQKYGLPGSVALCRPAAENWKVMKEAAQEDGVILTALVGYRTRQQQTKRIERYGEWYPKPGRTEHHLGLSLHIQGGERDGITTTQKQAKEWVWKYAHHFGFLAREHKQKYIHVRYLERLGEATYLHNNGLALETYLEAYDEHKKRRLSAEKKGIQIPMDGVAVLQSLVPGSILRSENACVASVLQTGKVIGNMTGKTEVTISVGQKVIRKIPCVVHPKPPLLLNRYNKLPCPVGNLVRLPMSCTFGDRIIYLEEKTAKAFEIMCEVARTQGIWLYAKQGYRSLDEQRKLIQYYTEREGAEAAALRCAPPGYSEHHSGLAIDVNGGVYKDGKKVEDSASVWAWVHDHCYEFGFFLKNLPGKEHVTGTRAEPWHVRYLGDLEVCRVLYERQITLDEYLDEML